MEWYEALLLGILQGLTEFLPISSSGHLEIASYILKTNPSENLIFKSEDLLKICEHQKMIGIGETGLDYF